VLGGSHEARREIVLVEGVMDLHQLRAHGVENAAALGGLGIGPKTFERLSHLGVERVTFCFDRDEPGRSAAARAIEQSGHA
jgi:DNA primase